jgi:hypothetical protein
LVAACVLLREVAAVIADATSIEARNDRKAFDRSTTPCTGAKLQEYLDALADADEITGLSVINCKDCELADHLEPLCALLEVNESSLVALNLDGNHLCAAQQEPALALVDPIAALSRLRALDISACSLLGPRSMRYKALNSLGTALAAHGSLTYLKAAYNGLHSEAAAVLSSWVLALPKLAHLDVSK